MKRITVAAGHIVCLGKPEGIEERGMSDRKLLELAAKAAGYKVAWHDVRKCFVHENFINTDNPPTMAGQRLAWSPLTDDGDAFRLAVALQIAVYRSREGITAETHGFYSDEKPIPDPYAATRRAIVRAAAEIGKCVE